MNEKRWDLYPGTGGLASACVNIFGIHSVDTHDSFSMPITVIAEEKDIKAFIDLINERYNKNETNNFIKYRLSHY
jgi:acetolactate synthase small subunit